MREQVLVRVNRIADVAVDIKSFELVRPDGGELPAYEAGAHVDVQVPGASTRAYSLCGDPRERGRFLIAVKEEAASRGASRALHAHVAEGDLLRISHPRNNFPLVAKARHHVLLAGGIGITPILGMVRQLRDAGASFELHYFARSVAHAAFRDELTGAGDASLVRFHLELGPAATQQRLGTLLTHRPEGAHLYLCGPGAFMQSVRAAAAATWPAQAIHMEYFQADPAAATAATAPFTLRLARSGITLQVPADRSVLQVLREQAVTLETGCEEGICGTCRTRVVEGLPDHRDSVLSDAERARGDCMLPCVSRALTPLLILDL